MTQLLCDLWQFILYFFSLNTFSIHSNNMYFFSCFILNNNTQMSSGATADLNEQIQKMIFFNCV